MKDLRDYWSTVTNGLRPVTQRQGSVSNGDCRSKEEPVGGGEEDSGCCWRKITLHGGLISSSFSSGREEKGNLSDSIKVDRTQLPHLLLVCFHPSLKHLDAKDQKRFLDHFEQPPQMEAFGGRSRVKNPHQC